MVRKRRILLVSLAVGVLGGLAWLVLRPPPEPVYEGKPLGYWLRHPTITRVTNFPVLGMFAIRFPKVDSNAVPFLLKALEHQDGVFDKQYGKLWARLPQRFRSHLVKPVYPGEIRGNAASILSKMGTNARPAIPALIHVMKNDEGRGARFSAATCLLSIGGGDETVKEAFREVLNDKSQSEGVHTMAERYLQSDRSEATRSAAVARPDFDIFKEPLKVGYP